MSRILVLKRTENDFDKYVVDNIKKNTPEVVVLNPFIIKGKVARKIIRIIKEYDINIAFILVSKLTFMNLKKYEQIIIFDDYPDRLLISQIKRKNSDCKIKMWFWNVPNYSIDEYRESCQLYCFDKNYCDINNVYHLNQFFFEDDITRSEAENTGADIVYVGYDKGRENILKRLIELFGKEDINCDFRIVGTQFKKTISQGLKYYKSPIPYSEILKLDMKSKSILELVTDNQKGLTWRALEALFFKRKLITNNAEIRNFDFYNRNNIFIYGVDDIESLKNFLKLPYVEIDKRIIQNYSYASWFSEISRT